MFCLATGSEKKTGNNLDVNDHERIKTIKAKDMDRRSVIVFHVTLIGR